MRAAEAVLPRFPSGVLLLSCSVPLPASPDSIGVASANVTDWKRH